MTLTDESYEPPAQFILTCITCTLRVSLDNFAICQYFLPSLHVIRSTCCETVPGCSIINDSSGRCGHVRIPMTEYDESSTNVVKANGSRQDRPVGDIYERGGRSYNKTSEHI